MWSWNGRDGGGDREEGEGGTAKLQGKERMEGEGESGKEEGREREKGWGRGEREKAQCRGKVDMVVCGAGIGGTVVGIGKKVKEQLPNCKVRREGGGRERGGERGKEREREGRRGREREGGGWGGNEREGGKERRESTLSCQVANRHMPSHAHAHTFGFISH